MSSLAIDIDVILRRIEGSKSNGRDVVLVEHDTMLKLIEQANRNEALVSLLKSARRELLWAYDQPEMNEIPALKLLADQITEELARGDQ